MSRASPGSLEWGPNGRELVSRETTALVPPSQAVVIGNEWGLVVRHVPEDAAPPDDRCLYIDIHTPTWQPFVPDVITRPRSQCQCGSSGVHGREGFGARARGLMWRACRAVLWGGIRCFTRLLMRSLAKLALVVLGALGVLFYFWFMARTLPFSPSTTLTERTSAPTFYDNLAATFLSPNHPHTHTHTHTQSLSLSFIWIYLFFPRSYC